jgi:Tol biopolymer transport system component
MTFPQIRKTALVITTCVLGFAFAWPGCTYSKSYFRLDENGKMIKADGPIEPGEFDGTTVGAVPGVTTGEGTGGSATGDDGTIVPPGGGTGTGTTTSTGGSTDGKNPAYAVAFDTKDRTTKKTGIGWGVASGNEFIVAPKPLVTAPDADTMIQTPALSPDGRSILYTTFKAGSTATKIPVFDLRVLSNLAQSPASDASWKANYGGSFAAWLPAGSQVIYTAGGLSLLKRTNADASNEKDEAPAPPAPNSGSLYGQLAVSPVEDASNPAAGWIVFTLFSTKSATSSMDLPLISTSAEMEQDPAISPDGKYLAYTSYDPTAKIHRIKLCDLAYASGSIQCSNARYLYPVEDLDNLSPCWSWDGQKLFFAANDTANKNVDIFVTSIGGGVASGKPPYNLTNTEGADESQLSCAAAVDYPVEPAPGP